MTVLATTQDPLTTAPVPATSTPATTPSTPAASSAAAPPIPADFAARLERAEKEAAEARREAAKYRTRNDEETAAKLKEQGDYKALHERSLPELEKAKKYDAFVEKEMKRLDAEVVKLAPHEQLALAKVGNLEDKLELLAAFNAARTTAPAPVPAATPPVTGGPPAAPATDFAAHWGKPTWADAKARDPVGAAAYVKKISSPALGKHSLDAVFNRRVPLQK